jgi:hypothetical protein
LNIYESKSIRSYLKKFGDTKWTFYVYSNRFPNVKAKSLEAKAGDISQAAINPDRLPCFQLENNIVILFQLRFSLDLYKLKGAYFFG